MDDDSPLRKYMQPHRWFDAHLGYSAAASRLVMSAIEVDDPLRRRKIFVRSLDTTDYALVYAPPDGHNVISSSPPRTAHSRTSCCSKSDNAARVTSPRLAQSI